MGKGSPLHKSNLFLPLYVLLQHKNFLFCFHLACCYSSSMIVEFHKFVLQQRFFFFFYIMSLHASIICSFYILFLHAWTQMPIFSPVLSFTAEDTLASCRHWLTMMVHSSGCKGGKINSEEWSCSRLLRCNQKVSRHLPKCWSVELDFGCQLTARVLRSVYVRTFLYRTYAHLLLVLHGFHLSGRCAVCFKHS